MRNIVISLIVGFGFSSFFAEILRSPQKQIQIIQNKIVYKDSKREFTEENFRKELAKYSWRFPEIVYAQAVIESGFNSDNFKKHNNLFGMKVAHSRLTTARKAKGTSHANYRSWQGSVVDRALYEASYLRKIKTEKEYLEYLGRNYATDKNYINKLKELIK